MRPATRRFLTNDYKLPTCSRALNVFHPYDPLAYRYAAHVPSSQQLAFRDLAAMSPRQPECSNVLSLACGLVLTPFS